MEEFMLEPEKIFTFIHSCRIYIILAVVLIVAILIVAFIVRKIKHLVWVAKHEGKKEFFRILAKYIFVLGLIALGIYLLQYIFVIVIAVILIPWLGSSPNIHDNYYENNR